MNRLRWDDLARYQTDIARVLKNSLAIERISHAYIFEGPLGTKRIETALLLAKTLLCKKRDQAFNPCFECHDCQRVDNRTHPNLFYVAAEGSQIKKRQIKDLLVEFSRASVERGPRIYIIDEAEKLNQDSANTLLKTMEEPTSEIYQFMITSEINGMLKTIISRAQCLHFRPIDKRIIREELLQQGYIPFIASGFSEYVSSSEHAVELMANTNYIESLELGRTLFHALENREESVILLFRSHQHIVFSRPEVTDFFLTILVLFMKDILNQKIHYHDLIVFSSEAGLLERLSGRISQKNIEMLIEKMLGLKSKLRYNINTSLAFDKILADLERGFNLWNIK
jgi:DNA polymerase-3 subunit delta'